MKFLLSYFVFPLNNETSDSWCSTYQHKGTTFVIGMMKLFLILSNKIKSPHTAKLRSKSILSAMDIAYMIRGSTWYQQQRKIAGTNIVQLSETWVFFLFETSLRKRQGFSCEFWKIFQNTFLVEHLCMTASILQQLLATFK